MAGKQDVFGNDVGDMVVMSASEAEISTGKGGLGFVLNASINYQMGVSPVATFGKDTLFVLSTPQGQFSFGTVAGNGLLKVSLKNCYGDSLGIKFKSANCKGANVTSAAMQAVTKNNVANYVMEGAFTNGLSIQGQAQDAFFTQNVTGIFHYLKDVSNK